jgi:hypothetical protein
MGPVPTGTAASTELLAVSITDTLFEVRFATWACPPSGVTETPPGLEPTGIVAITVFVAVSITATWFALSTAT